MMSMGSPGLTKAIKWLMIATGGVYVLQLFPFSGQLLQYYASLIPFLAFLHGQIWRVATYIFMHDISTPFHILVNMLMLWMFGTEMENLWGARKFTFFYLLCGVGSGLFSIISLFTSSYAVPVIGASGAVLGVLTAYAYYYPQRQILLFFILPINIRVFVIGFALYSVFGALIPHGNISHLTHLGGIIIALSYLKLYPYISERIQDYSKIVNEKRQRRDSEVQRQKKRFFEEQVDPILEKINREGMQSLTSKEKDILKKAALQDKERFKKKKIIPLDLFR